MRVIAARQTQQRSVYVVYNDLGQLVGRLVKDRLVTAEEAMKLAREFRKDHPQLFPSSQEKQKTFNTLFGGKKHGWF